MQNTIRRNLALKQMDIKEDPEGKPVTFSIVFVTKTGHRVFLPRAMQVGLPYSSKANRLRGVLPVDHNGDKTSHVYPVSIDNILEFNSLEIIL
jgi:hypothetical protein